MEAVAQTPVDNQSVAYLRRMARGYERLAQTEPHRTMSDLFAAIAADYSELAAAAAGRARAAGPVPARAGAVRRWLDRIGRGWRRPVAGLPASLTLPPAPTGAK